MVVTARKAGMRNKDDNIVDSYIPRRCAWTNRLITAKDHSSVRIAIAKLSHEGTYCNEVVHYDICGFVRHMGRSDTAINTLSYRNALMLREM